MAYQTLIEYDAPPSAAVSLCARTFSALRCPHFAAQTKRWRAVTWPSISMVTDLYVVDGPVRRRPPPAAAAAPTYWTWPLRCRSSAWCSSS